MVELQIRKIKQALQSVGPQETVDALTLDGGMTEAQRQLLQAVRGAIATNQILLARDPDFLPAVIYQQCVAEQVPPSEIAVAFDGETLPGLRLKHPVRLPTTEQARLVQESAPTALACSPDGQTIATGGSRGELNLYNALDGTLLARLEGHHKRITALVYDADGESLISASADRSLKIWSIPWRRCVRTLLGHQGGVNTCAWSEDGRWILSGGDDRRLIMWDLETGELNGFIGHAGWVTACALHPDGLRAVSGSTDHTVRLWDLTTGQAQVLYTHRAPVTDCRFGPGGETLVSSDADGVLKVWDVAHGWFVGDLKGHGGRVNRLDIDQRGLRILSASADRTVGVWNLKSGKKLGAIQGHQREVQAVAWAADGRAAWSGAMDLTARRWSTDRMSEAGILHGDAVAQVAFAPTGRWAATASRDATLGIWDVQSGARIHTLVGHQGGVNGLAVAPDGGSLVSVSNDGSMALWETEGFERVWSIVAHEGQPITAIHRQGRLLITGGRDGCLRGWDGLTGGWRLSLPAEGWITAVCISADGQWVAAGNEAGQVWLWALKTGEVRWRLERPAPITRLMFDPHHHHLIAADAKGWVSLADISQGAWAHHLQAHTDGVTDLELWDGRLLSASLDATVKIWAIETLHMVYTHPVAEPLGCISAQGRIVAAGDRTGNLWVFDATGGLIAP